MKLPAVGSEAHEYFFCPYGFERLRVVVRRKSQDEIWIAVGQADEFGEAPPSELKETKRFVLSDKEAGKE